MPTHRFLVGPRLLARIARRARELALSPENYLAKLIWRDVGQAAEEKAIAKLRHKSSL